MADAGRIESLMEGERADIEDNVFGSIDLKICRLAQTHDWDAGVELIEAQVCGGHHLCQHDDLSGVHRNGKRNHNRFPIFCLQTR